MAIYTSEEEILAAGLPWIEQNKELRKFRAGVALSKRLNTPKDTTQDAINKELLSQYNSNQYYGVKNIQAQIAAESVANAVPVKRGNIKPINENIANYLTVGRDRQVSGIVTEFLATFIKSGATDFDKAWKDYTLNAPKIKDDPYNAGLKQAAEQTIKMLGKRYKQPRESISGYKYQGNISDVQIDSKRALPVNLNALYNSDKTRAMLFTGRKTSESELAKSAEKVLSTYNKLQTISYITPTGIVKFDNTRGILSGPASDGDIRPEVMQKLADNYTHNNAQGFKYSSLDAHVNVYNKHQAKVDGQATRQIEALLGIAVRTLRSKNRTDSQVNKILDMDVKQFKNYGSQFAEFNNLQNWTSRDHMSVRELVSQQAVDSTIKDANKHTQALNAVRTKVALKKAYKLADGLGVDKATIKAETLNFLRGKGTDAKTRSLSFGKNLSSLNEYLTDSKLQIDTLYKGKSLRQLFPKRDKWLKMYATEPAEALNHMFHHIGDNKILKQMGLLEENSINPILNLKGKVQERFMKHLAGALMTRRNLSKIPIDSEFLDLLASRKLSNTEDVFIRAHDNVAWQDFNVDENTRSNIKLKAMDALYDFNDALDNRKEGLSQSHSKFYEASKLDYLNTQRLQDGEEIYLDSSKRVIQSLDSLTDLETRHRAEQAKKEIIKEGFRGTPSELLRAVQERVGEKASGGTELLSMNDELFAEKNGKPNKFRTLESRRAQGRLTIGEHEMLHKAFHAYNGHKASSDREMLSGLAAMEFDYFSGEDSDQTRNVWVRTSKYLKGASTYGAGQAIIQSYLDLGLVDMKKLHNFGFKPGKFSAAKGKKYTPNSKIINYEKLIGKTQGILINDNEPGGEYAKITKGLLDYLDPKNSDKLQPGQAAVYTKLKNGQAMITGRERAIYNAIAKDQLAAQEHQARMDAGETFDAYTSKVDKNVVIESLAASQGIGREQYGKVKLSEFDAAPQNISLTKRMAENLNKSSNLLRFETDTDFNAKVSQLATGNALDPMIYGEKGLTTKAQSLNYIFSKLDQSNLAAETKDKIRLTGNDLFTKYDEAYGKSPMNSLVFHNALNTYMKDVNTLLQPRYSTDSDSIKKTRETLDNRFSKHSSEHATIDGYYIPTVKKLVNNVSGAYTSTLGLKDEYKAGSQITEEHKKLMALKANDSIAQSYGSSFLPNLSQAELSLVDYDTNRAKRTTREFPDTLEKSSNKHRLVKAPVQRLAKQKSRGKTTWSKGALELLGLKSGFFKFAKGGKIPGDGNIDEVPALLMKGETVLDKKTSKMLGIHSQDDYERFKSAVQNNLVTKFANAGHVEGVLVDLDTGEPIDPSAALKNRLGKSVTDNSLESEPVSKSKATGVKEVAPLIAPETQTKIDLEQTNKSDIPKKTAAANAKLLDTKIGSINLKNLQSDIEDKIFTDSKTKDIFNAARAGFDPEQSLNEVLRAGNIVNADQGKALSKLAEGPIAKSKIRALTETAKAGIINEIATSSLEDLNKALKNPNTAAVYTDAIKTPGKIVSKDTKVAYAKAQDNMARVMLNDFEGISKVTANGATSIENFSSPQQDEINKLKSDPEKYKQFQDATGGRFNKVFTSDSKISPLTRSLNLVANNIDNFNKVFNSNFDKPKTQKDLMHMADTLSEGRTGRDYSYGKSADLQSRIRYFKALSSVIDETQPGMAEKQDKLNEMAAQVGTSKHLKDSSKMRWSNFSDLMTQNAAFGASYTVLGTGVAALKGGFDFVTGLDERLHNLKAITGSTDAELGQMAKSVKMVSTQTKFSANEIADAATVLGQAGFSAQDIKQSLGSVVKLATATGSALEDATQTITSAITVWDAPMRDSAKFADEFTAAINQSKLDIKSLSLALQYTGNIAAQGGVPVEDVLTLTSLMKDAGIKQGSTVGTGQRLVISDILSPSKKFSKSLSAVGVSKSDLSNSFQDGGIIDALQLMKDSGYGFGQATRGMEVRERAAYLAISGQLDKAKLFRSNIMTPGAADAANETQMKAFNNRLKNMVNSWGIGLDEMMNSRTSMLGNLMDSLTYNPSQDTNSPFDLETGVYDQLASGQKDAPFGKALGLAAAAGAGGYAYYKGRAANADLVNGKGRLQVLNPKSSMFRPKAALLSGAKNIGKGGLAAVGLTLGSQLALSDDPWHITLAKELPRYVVGGAAAAGTAFVTKNPLAAQAAGYAGYQAFDSTLGKFWDSLFTDNPTKEDVLSNISTRLDTGVSTRNDLSKNILEVGKLRGNPLRYKAGDTESEKSVARLATIGRGETFNNLYKKDIELIAKQTGEVVDFSNLPETDSKQSVDVLTDKLIKFQETLGGLIDRSSEEMFKDMDKAMETLKLSDAKDPRKLVLDTKGKVNKLVSKLANSAPELLSTQFDRLEKFISDAADEAGKKASKGTIEARYNARRNLPGKSDAVKKLDTESAAAKLDAEAFKTSSTEALKQAVLTAHASIQTTERLVAHTNALEKLYANDKITLTEFNQTNKKIDKKALTLSKQEAGINKFEERLLNIIADVTKVNNDYKGFYRTTARNAGNQVASLGRTNSIEDIKAAVDISQRAFGDYASIAKQAGLDTLTGKSKGFLKFLNESPTTDRAIQSTKVRANQVGVDGFNNSLLGNAASTNAMQLKAIQMATKSVENFAISIDKSKITDAADMMNYIARDYKFQDLGFKPGSSETVAALGLNDLSVADAIAGPLSDIAALTDNLNPIKQRQLEISKFFQEKRIDDNATAQKNKATGQGEGPYTYATSAQGIAQQKRQDAYQRSMAAYNRQVDFQREQAFIKFDRSIDKLEDNLDFQRDNLEINYKNNIAAAARQYQFKVALAGIQYGYKISDINRQTGYQKEDLRVKTERAIEDLKTSNSRKLSDLNKSFDRQVKAINIGFSRQVDAIERSREDTRDFFDRSLTRPINIKLNPESFLKVAEVLDDNTLALEAHKASLTMNTDSIKQLIDIQKSKEDVAKQAYISAYKGVGGNVYNEDGTINSDFTDLFNQYTANNSSKVIDSVLNNALDTTFGGAGFDINQALTDPSYIAQQVHNPSEGVTTESIAQGSGLTTQDVVDALLGNGSGEITLTTTQGVVLEAQGDLAGAIFDLETQMIKYDIQLREAGIKFQQSLEDSALSLEYSLEDLNLAFTRGLEDINLAMTRGLEDITTNNNRAIADAGINYQRNLDTMALSYQFQVQEAATRFQEQLDALARQEAFNKEQMAKSLQDLLDDMAANSNFNLSEGAINNEENRALINQQFTQLVDNIDLASESAKLALSRAFDSAIQRMYLDHQIIADQINISMKRATLEKRINLAFMIEEINKSMDVAAADMQWKWAGLMKGITTSLDKMATDENVKLSFEKVGVSIQKTLLEAFNSVDGTTLKELTNKYDDKIIETFRDSITYQGKARTDAEQRQAEELQKATTKYVNTVVGTTSSSVEVLSTGMTNVSNIQVELAKLAGLSSTAMVDSLNQILDLKAQINAIAGSYTSSPSAPVKGKATGGPIPGYGGGDIVHRMLEPGEFVIRKEAALALGPEMLMTLNNPISANLISKPKDIAVGLASSPSDSTNGNNINNDFSIGINVSTEGSVDHIENNIERIADGVRRVFEEYV